MSYQATEIHEGTFKLLSEWSQSERPYTVILSSDILEKAKLYSQLKGSVVSRERGRDEQVKHRIIKAVKLFYMILQ